MTQAQDHPLRRTLNDEIHGRAGHAVEPPAEVLHFAFTLDAGDADPTLMIGQLCREMEAEDGCLAIWGPTTSSR